MMRKIILLLSISLLNINSNAQQTANLLFHWQDTTLVGSWAYDNTYNECWGMVVNDREIAIIGSTAGTHFFDVTDPVNSTEVAFVAGAYTGGGVIHRDYHDFEGYLYVVCDEGSLSTLQIIDISNLPTSVNTVYDSNALFTKSHNIYIDTATAKLYACASNSAMDVYDLHVPTNPTLIYSYNAVGHVHDAFVRNDTAYLNCGNQGLRVMDFSMVNAMGDQPTQLATFTSYRDAGYNHSGWLNDDGTLYIMQDENHGYDVKILDVADLSNISVLSTWEYDTYAPNSHASYKGAWGVYPYLPSGNIIVSDMQTGLYIFECGTPTAIIENKLTHNFYPNPATNQFTINNTNADNFSLYNSLGAKVMDQEINSNQTTINRGRLSNGLYFYTLNKKGALIESGKVLFE
jgi:hypothetical protein